MRTWWSFLVFMFVAILAPPAMRYLTRKDLGLFFGWEIGVVVQNIIIFWDFVKVESIPYVTPRKKKWLDMFMLTVLVVSMVSYFLVKLFRSGELVLVGGLPSAIRLVEFIVTNAISLVPIVLYFLVNVFLRAHIKHRCSQHDSDGQAWVEALSEIIWFIDLPCLIPYIVVIVFAYMNRSLFDWQLFVSGAGALLLLTSNLLTESIGKKIKSKL